MTADAALVERLAAHERVGAAPRAELEWLAEHGELQHYAAGALLGRPGELLPVGTVIVLSGHVAHYRTLGGVRRKIIEWRAGGVTGQLPYSRMGASIGETVVEEPTDVLNVPRELVPSLPVVCPTVTAVLVHEMIDRARLFKTTDLQVEKMASLGKLAAGLAHELNNPAAAAARSATLLADAFMESDRASRALGAAGLSADESDALHALQQRCMANALDAVLSPLERADREEALAAWLANHGVDEAVALPLADAGLTPAMLDELAMAVGAPRLAPAVRWIASGCVVRGLVRDVGRAATRVHELVKAVKGFTFMDHAAAPEAVDLRRSVGDTVRVLASKAKARAATLTVAIPDDVPSVRAVGGELNQVWMNLLDNALDAIAEGGHVSVEARVAGRNVAVEVIDDGSGIPDDLRSRIFDPFFTTKQVGKGTGLGLDITRQLVERNAGQIDVESAPGRTVFRVTLPAGDDSAVSAAPPSGAT